MSIFEYMNLVSGYIINKLENKRDSQDTIELSIKPVRDPFNSELGYEISELKNYKEQVFVMRIPCNNKEAFYNALNILLIQYLKNSDLIIYTATSWDEYEKPKFSIVTKNRTTVSFFAEDESERLVFEGFKTYLDEERRNFVNVESQETFELDQKEDDVKTYNKIML